MALWGKEHMSNHCPFWERSTSWHVLVLSCLNPRATLWPLGLLGWLQSLGLALEEADDPPRAWAGLSSANDPRVCHGHGDKSWARSRWKGEIRYRLDEDMPIYFPRFQRVSVLVQPLNVSELALSSFYSGNTQNPNSPSTFQTRVSQSSAADLSRILSWNPLSNAEPCIHNVKGNTSGCVLSGTCPPPVCSFVVKKSCTAVTQCQAGTAAANLTTHLLS